MKKSLSALKEKFGKFEISKEQIKGGEEVFVTMGCPRQGCAAYWGNDSAGYSRCIASGCKPV